MKTQASIEEGVVFTGISRVNFPRSKSREEHMTGMRKVMTIWWQLVFATISRVRLSCEIFAKHSVLLFWFICSTMSLPTLYILTLPKYCKEFFFREKTLANTLVDCSINAYFICVIVHVQMWYVYSIACRLNPKRFLSILYLFESVFMLLCFEFLFIMHFLCFHQKLLQGHVREKLATKLFL